MSLDVRTMHNDQHAKIAKWCETIFYAKNKYKFPKWIFDVFFFSSCALCCWLSMSQHFTSRHYIHIFSALNSLFNFIFFFLFGIFFSMNNLNVVIHSLVANVTFRGKKYSINEPRKLAKTRTFDKKLCTLWKLIEKILFSFTCVLSLVLCMCISSFRVWRTAAMPNEHGCQESRVKSA